MIGPLYEHSLAGSRRVQVESADGGRRFLDATRWMAPCPGDDSILDRCGGPTLDVGSGPGRLTVALAERRTPALGIDITPYAVRLTLAAGGSALVRDVFARVPGTGRWMTVILADGNIGIGGAPTALLRRIAELLAPGGQVLVEVEAPGEVTRIDRVRLLEPAADRPAGPWFRWAYVGRDDIASYARAAELEPEETWTEARRWFAVLRKPR